MRVRIDKAALMLPLTRAANAADQRSNNTSITGCVHLSASDTTLTLQATDYEINLHTSVQADVQEPGEAVINAKALHQVVHGLPSGAVITLSVEVTGKQHKNYRMRIETGRIYYHLNGMAPEEYPTLEQVAGKGIVIEKAHFAAMLKRTLFSTSTDDSRPAITGVLLTIEPRDDGSVNLLMVSTDGHRLSCAQRTAVPSERESGSQSCIIHRRGAAELQRLLDGVDPLLRISFSGRKLEFESDGAKLMLRPIDATFPDYRKVIPDPERVVKINKAVLVSSIKRVLALGKTDTLKMELSANSISLDATYMDCGDAHEELAIEGWAGDVLRIGYNPKYLLDALNGLDSETVQLGVIDQMSPSLLSSDEDPGTQYVVMPVRL